MESRGRDYLDRVRQGFLVEAARNPTQFLVIDASPDVQTLHDQIHALVGKFLSDLGHSPANRQ
jgi:thymidylate kinase